MLTPWSAPDSGPPATRSDSFQITSGCGGGFSPSFTAGTTQQPGGWVQPVHRDVLALRPGPEHQRGHGQDAARAVGGRQGCGTLPRTAGLPGHVWREQSDRAHHGRRGRGSEPVLRAGRPGVLHGPLQGRAVRALRIVVPAVAGPFNLGNVVVRAAVSVDPHTAQITVVSDPLPTILQGIPLDVRTVNVTIDRSGFMFNPTSCDPLSVGGSLYEHPGRDAPRSPRVSRPRTARTSASSRRSPSPRRRRRARSRARAST